MLICEQTHLPKMWRAFQEKMILTLILINKMLAMQMLELSGTTKRILSRKSMKRKPPMAPMWPSRGRAPIAWKFSTLFYLFF